MKKIIWMASLFLFLLILGCSQDDNGASNQDISEPVDYSNPEGKIVWSSGSLSGLGLRQELIEGFEEKYPNVEVELQEAPSTTNQSQTYYTTTIGGQSEKPDIYSGDSNWPAQFGNANIALDLSEIMPDEFWDRFPDTLVDSVTYEGGIYGAPFYDNIGVLYYRKDILEEEGLEVPSTWEELQDMSIELKEKGLVDYGFVWQGASYEGLTTNFLEYLHAANGEVLDENEEVNINTRETEKALSFMQELVNGGATPSAVATFHEDEATTTFSSGSAAFLRNWMSYYGQLKDPEMSAMSENIGISALPAFEGGERHTTQSGWNVFINPNTQNLEASLAFMDYLTGEEAQRIMLEGHDMIPTNTAVTEDPELIDEYEILEIYQEAITTPRPKTPNYNALSEGIYMNVNEMIVENNDVQDILDTMEDQMKSANDSGL
ncbi:ABC transporter substrate-binding protein [Gracilibacillus timonensis]|uniref:ABC transporter substrate-binding protein n=1 Tax=Gracilibacillus timonensis TaxID=1816696 RepID=UPI000826BE7F|nr:ABC transporter substrate-binding protein [Gracilibacillus timonensis]